MPEDYKEAIAKIIELLEKLHPGFHQVAVIINGKEFEKHDFELIEIRKPSGKDKN